MQQTPIRTEVIEVLERKTREVGWFPEVGVTGAYFHGNRKFHDASSFAWQNESVIEQAQENANRLCEAYQIGPDSSLELVLFRSNLEIVKVREERAYREWDHPENRRNLPANRLLSSYRIWSSKSGDAPPIDQWEKTTVQFLKAFPITGDKEATPELAQHFRVELFEIDKELMYLGIGLSSGQIANLSFENLPDGGAFGAGRFAKLTGEIEIAVDPRVDETARTNLLGLVQAGINIGAHPHSNAVHWDGVRCANESLSWTVLEPAN
jgi:hypothetical protein